VAELVSLDELNDALNLGGSSDHDDELQVYIDAVTAHVERAFGVLPSGAVTEVALVSQHSDGVTRILPAKSPILEVTSLTDANGTEYTTGFTITPDGWIEHDNLTLSGRWTVEYEAGFSEVPADLKLAALEDIRGLYQPGQIGPPAQFGAFGIESTDVGPTYRPVRMWPRVDAWLERDVLPGQA
jgi:hypothetical protein